MNNSEYAAQLAKSAYGLTPDKAEKQFSELKRLADEGVVEASNFLMLLQGGVNSKPKLSQALGEYFPEYRSIKDTSYRDRAEQALGEMMGKSGGYTSTGYLSAPAPSGAFRTRPEAFKEESNRLKALAESGDEQAKAYSTFFNRYMKPIGVVFPEENPEKYGAARRLREEREAWNKMTPETRRSVYGMIGLPAGAKVKDLQDK